MVEIILSFFAAIGIVFIFTLFFDFLFYRKYRSGFILKMDLRGKNIEEIIFDLEMVHTVRSNKSGEAVIESVEILCDKGSTEIQKIYDYMKIFSLPGIVIKNE